LACGAARVAYGLRDYFGATRISRVNARRFFLRLAARGASRHSRV